MANVCIISRLMTLDLPYYAEWLEYHDRLGVDHFYLFYCDDTHLPLQETLAYFPKEKVTVVPLPKEAAEANPMGRFADLIGEEFILHIDSDEFLVLPGQDLESFLASYDGIDYFRFPWFMNPSMKADWHESLAAQASSIPGYQVSRHKSMARRRTIRISGDPHDFELREGGCRIFASPGDDSSPYIHHFSFRGRVDALLKCREQHLSYHADGASRLERFLSRGEGDPRLAEFPSRILVALGEVQCANPREIRPLPLDLQSRTHSERLQTLTTASERANFCQCWQGLLACNLATGLMIRDQPKKEVLKFLGVEIAPGAIPEP